MISVLSGCSGNVKPIATVPQVDLNRFMGDWYVIANIPTFLEKGAHNAVETYRLMDDGRIATTFAFNAGSFDGKRKQFNPIGTVRDTQTNATWDMQFLWPFQAEYKVMYLDEDYQQTIIGRSKRDYVWLMARQPQISDEDYQQRLQFMAEQGYDISKVQKVPQLWEGQSPAQPQAQPQGGK